MPIFQIKNKKTNQIGIDDFKSEKELQDVVENNLQELLGIEFIASEFWTGGIEGGYIDTLGLDENNAPVVIEYKWDQKNNVINQGLYYLDRLLEHKGDLELVVQKKLSKETTVNWRQPRLIIIAKSYSKYDQYAVKRMGGNIELIKYTLYKDGLLNLETVSTGLVVAGKPQVIKKETTDPFQKRLDWLTEEARKFYLNLREEILGIDEEISEKHFKNGVSFRLGNRTFVSVSPWKSYLRIYLLYKEKLEDPKGVTRSLEGIGTVFAARRDFEIKTVEEIPYAIKLIKQAYNSIV